MKSWISWTSCSQVQSSRVLSCFIRIPPNSLAITLSQESQASVPQGRGLKSAIATELNFLLHLISFRTSVVRLHQLFYPHQKSKSNGMVRSFGQDLHTGLCVFARSSRYKSRYNT